MKQTMPLEPPALLRAEEAARITSLGRSTIFKMLSTGELRAVRIGRAVRVRRSDLDAWIAERADAGDHPSAA